MKKRIEWEKSGSKLEEIETIKKIRKYLIDFLRGYPIWRYHGIFESVFEVELGTWIVKKLDEHNILEVAYAKNEGERTYYSLTPKGVEIAISLSNRVDSERILDYAKETHKFNKWIIGLTIGLSVIGLAQLILVYLQKPIF